MMRDKADKLDEEGKLEFVRDKYYNIYWVSNQSDELQIAAIGADIRAVEEIDNLSKAGQKEYVRRLNYGNELQIDRALFYIRHEEALELFNKMLRVHKVIK
jgi:predicted membrane GTPase involved in stress response